MFKFEVKWSSLDGMDIKRILRNLRKTKTPFDEDKELSYVIVGKDVEWIEEDDLYLYDLEHLMNLGLK